MKLRLFLIALLTPTPAVASSPAAWEAGNAVARRACIAAAGLKASTVSAPILFSDTTMKTAFLIAGVYPQKHMKGARGTMLCLYDRRTKKAEASEALGVRFPAAVR